MLFAAILSIYGYNKSQIKHNIYSIKKETKRTPKFETYFK